MRKTEKPYLTMLQVADLLCIEGPKGEDRRKRRSELAVRHLRRLEKRTGEVILVDAGGDRWLAHYSSLVKALPSLHIREKNLESRMSILEKRLESLENWKRLF